MDHSNASHFRESTLGVQALSVVDGGNQESKRARPILILLVEDRLNDAKLFQKVLSTAEDAGRYWLIHAKRLSSAISMLEKERVDAVVLDLSLPDSEGVGAIGLIRERAPHVPIVVLTGSSESDFLKDALRRGAQEFISKDQMTGELLSTAIRNSIERSRHRSKVEIELSKEKSGYEVDPETQLYTDRTFRIRLEYALEQARRDAKILGLMLIRIEGFELDGEQMPANLLSVAWSFLADRLNHSIRGSDSMGRMNETTLALLCYDVHDLAGVHRLSAKISHLLQNPFRFENGELKVLFQMGVAISPFDEVDASLLFVSAERALDYAKQNGRNQFSFASKLLNIRAADAANQIELLKLGLSTQSFEIFGTPIIETKTRHPLGFQLGFSMSVPDLSSISHEDLLDLIDLAGLRQTFLALLSEKVAAFESKRLGAGFEKSFYCLRLTPSYLFSRQLLPQLKQPCSNGSEISWILDIGEEVLSEKGEQAYKLFDELKTHGVKIRISDFGMRTASITQLAFLKRFDLHSIGVASSLSRELAGSSEDKKDILFAICEAIRLLGIHSLVQGRGDEDSIALANKLGTEFCEDQSLWSRTAIFSPSQSSS